jgi:hypothetical protein
MVPLHLRRLFFRGSFATGRKGMPVAFAASGSGPHASLPRMARTAGGAGPARPVIFAPPVRQ